MTSPSTEYLQGASDERAKLRALIARLIPQAYDMHSLANVVNLLRDWLAVRGESPGMGSPLK